MAVSHASQQQSEQQCSSRFSLVNQSKSSSSNRSCTRMIPQPRFGNLTPKLSVKGKVWQPVTNAKPNDNTGPDSQIYPFSKGVTSKEFGSHFRGLALKKSTGKKRKGGSKKQAMPLAMVGWGVYTLHWDLHTLHNRPL